MLQGTTSPAYNQAYTNAQAINYDPLQQASNRAGQVYGGMADIAGQQVNQFGQQGQQAQQQQGMLYGAGKQILNTAQDPQNALYGRTQQQLTDQVRAGQAARGLGNSAVGASEENQAMSNFNIDWQNNQLQRQATAGQAASGLANAGLGQGNLYNADMSAQMTAGNNQAQNLGLSAQTPLNAQQMIAGMPATNANAYLQNYGNLDALYANQMSSSIPYMNQGIGATQYNAGNQIANNQAMGKLYGQAAGAVGNAFGKYLGSDSGGASTGNAYGSSNWQSPIDTSGNFGYTGGTGGTGGERYSASFGTTPNYDFGSF
jgi:hypothetical protein